MPYKLSLLLCLSCVFVALTAAQKRPTQLNLWSPVTKEGQIDLQKDSMGFYVSVDFQENPSDASDSDAYDPSIGIMSLALYTSHTILSNSCLQFNQYPCDSYGCSPYPSWPSDINLPYFIADGYLVNAQVYLDYNNWILNNYAILANSCPSNTSYPYGSSRYGVLGLGFNSSRTNFINSSVFSINLDRSGVSGTLLFASNSDITSSSKNVATFTADSNWHISAKEMTIKVGDLELSLTTRIIFDLDADAIGLPLSIYQEFLTNFQDANPDVPCNNANYKPTCSYNGRIGDLKNIKMTIQGQKIELPPTLYIEDQTDADVSIDSSFTLNFKALDSSLTDESYVTPEYENYIIFDQNFLSFYYAEFSAIDTGYTIDLYTQYDTSASTDSPVWPYIVGGIAGFFLLALTICCICACVKKRRQRRRATRRVIQSANDNPTDRAPLVVNDQAINNNYQPNAYYPPYNYHQNIYSGYPQQNQASYGHLPGYTYIPQQAGSYPYLPPAQGQVYGNMGQNNAIQQGVQERGQGAE